MHPPILISTVLHLAADSYLWNGCSGHNRCGFSCWAIDDAVDDAVAEAGNADDSERYRKIGDISQRINEGLTTLGLDTGSMHQFDEFMDDKERQGARYLWLKFAALLAEEQGV